MRITYVVTRSSPVGGAQVHVRDLSLALLRAGHQPSVVTSGTGEYTDALRAAGVPTVSIDMEVPINPVRDLRALRQLRFQLRKLRPDLVSTHSAKAGILGRLAARSLDLPVIYTAHGWPFTVGVPALRAQMYRGLEWMAAPWADRIITVSEFDRQLALSRKVASENQLVTVHNGMPDIDERFRADPSRSPARMAMVARFEPQKDHTTLLRALAGLTQEPWHLDLIGDGPLLPEAQRLAHHLGLSERIHFWGQRTDVAARLAEAQLLLLITNWEGFPRSILEAMRAGLPVIASLVGGVAEAVEDGETGFTVTRGDAGAVRERIRQLLANPRLRAQMGRKGRKQYEQQFTLTRTVQQTLAIYQEVIQPDQRVARQA